MGAPATDGAQRREIFLDGDGDWDYASEKSRVQVLLMKNLSIMLKPASSACNLRCSYCFYRDVSCRRDTASYGFLSVSDMEQILDNIFQDLVPGDRVSFVFQGGEPMLVGLDFYRHFTNYCKPQAQRGVDIHYALQTNGILLDEEWCTFLRENHFLVGLSLDGPAKIHNAQRKAPDGSGTFHQVMDARKLLEQSGTQYNVLMVLTREMARHPKEIWNFLVENQLQYVQFIPCLDELDGQNTPWGITPERYADFYRGLFDLWLAAFRQGRYFSIKLFDDYIQLLARGIQGSCGQLGRCSPQIVVEADGSVYPCDFYVLDAYRAGNLRSQSLREVFLSPKMQEFARREVSRNPACDSCPFLRICGGGCARMRKQVFSPGKNGICGHRIFLEDVITSFSAIARTLH